MKQSTHLQTWVAAKSADNFSKFAPVLKQWIDLVKIRCEHRDSSKPVYDVALQDFEKGMTSTRLDEIFSEVHSRSPSSNHFHLQATLKGLDTRVSYWKYSPGNTCKTVQLVAMNVESGKTQYCKKFHSFFGSAMCFLHAAQGWFGPFYTGIEGEGQAARCIRP